VNADHRQSSAGQILLFLHFHFARLRGRPVAEPKIMFIHSLAVALGPLYSACTLSYQELVLRVGFHLADGCRIPAEMRIYPRALRIVYRSVSILKYALWLLGVSTL